MKPAERARIARYLIQRLDRVTAYVLRRDERSRRRTWDRKADASRLKRWHVPPKVVFAARTARTTVDPDAIEVVCRWLSQCHPPAGVRVNAGAFDLSGFDWFIRANQRAIQEALRRAA